MTPRRASSFRDRQPEERTAVRDSVARVLSGWRESRPDLQVEPIAITARLARINALLGPRLEAVFARFGLRGADFAVMASLVRLADENVSQSRLASELGLSAGTVSLRVDRLERQGLAERRPDPSDGRGALVALTPRGRELFEASAPEHLDNAQDLLAGLSEGERELLGNLLGKLLYTLEDGDPQDRFEPNQGMVVDAAPVALERRRAVGLPPLAGLLVRHVDPAGPAAASGIKPGDLLRSANRRPLRTRHDLNLAVSQSRPRGAVALDVTRGSESLRLRLAAPTG